MFCFNIIIVENDKHYPDLLRQYYFDLCPRCEVKVVDSEKALMKIMSPEVHIITFDDSLPGATGVALIKKLKTKYPLTEILVISAQKDVGTAVNFLKEGAFDYILKNGEIKDRLRKALLMIKEKNAPWEEKQPFDSKMHRINKILPGNSFSLKKVIRGIEKAAESNINVLITGETGTGKELVAKAVHYSSNRKSEPFVAINVSAIPGGLIENELFGHEEGAFTGAVSQSRGKFEEAGKGTLLLDEIGEMDLRMQAKLLRVLQEREVTRIGGNNRVRVECRIICATNRKLSDEVIKGNFRQDLYYRIMGLPIDIPPLRERKEDIPELAGHFIREFAVENNMTEKKLSPDAASKLHSYIYPGNVRELKSIIDLAMVLSESNRIEPADIRLPASSFLSKHGFDEMTLEEYHHKIVNYFLEKYNNDVIKVAHILDIGKSTIYRMIKEKQQT